MPRRYYTTTYPNGRHKSNLYDQFLSAADFGCSQRDYNFEIEMALREERAGTPSCVWYFDSDGRIVVDELSLVNRHARVLVTDDGFQVSGSAKPLIQIFVSYARENESAANVIADALDRAGYATWRDKEALLAGQPWKVKINDAIDQSDLFVAVLSHRSVEKTGYVHAELRRALERQAMMPGSRVFIIPVRIDECDMPFKALEELHRVDCFPKFWDGVGRLLTAVRDAERHVPAA